MLSVLKSSIEHPRNDQGRTRQRAIRFTDISANISIGAVNIVGKRTSEKGCWRLRRGNEKRREAELSRAFFAHNIQ
ncbi:hypothetical protein [Mesorhizobium tianshanense]|uniref:hypothetical protein n=1 Tax=Mesorhizobium tianshanense TaxID=39844 RepID=UPI0011A201FA|nr:hypothetical protein [Mesorhizobium tianshanense]